MVKITSGTALKEAIIELLPGIKDKYETNYIVFILTWIVSAIVLLFLTTSEDNFANNTFFEHSVNFLGWILMTGLFIFLIFGFSLVQGSETITNFFYEQIWLKGYKKIEYTHQLLNDSMCSFIIDGNEKVYVAELYVKAQYLVNDTAYSIDIIKSSIDRIMPHTLEYEKQVYIYGVSSNLIDNDTEVENNLEEIKHRFVSLENDLLTNDILTKGNDMLSVYYYLYCLENYLREFIVKKSILLHGENYLQDIFINKSTKKKILDRKEKEKKLKYISLRGGNDLHYVDFKELGDIIIGNKFLSDHFPNENWVKAKVEEVGNIRNLVAHNSYVGKHELDIVTITLQSFIQQTK